jgi:hypothetical protein
MGSNQFGSRNLNLITQVTILMFTSGHMFNTIRHTPYVQPNGQGGFNYIAGGFQSQFGVETQIVASLCKSFIFTYHRWHIGICNSRACNQSAYDSRSHFSIYCSLGVDCWDFVHLLLLDIHLPDEERRISIQAISLVGRNSGSIPILR